jgi:Mg-chelatase subunit ChlD
METTNNNFTNKTTLYHFIIDRSGSMSGMEKMVVGGYNEHVASIKNLQATYPDQKFLMSLTVFDHEITTLVHPSPIVELQELPADAFTPRGSTALLDAIGKSNHLIESEFAKAIKNDEMSVVMIIITDGEENSSQFFSYEAIAKQIKERDETGKWTFSFIGCDFDALDISDRLNIRRENVRNFQKRNYGILSGFMDDSLAHYAKSKSEGNITKRLFEF